MSVNKGTMLKLKKQTSVAMAEMNNKRIVDEGLFTPMYMMVNLVTDEVKGPLSFDDAMKHEEFLACKLERIKPCGNNC